MKRRIAHCAAAVSLTVLGVSANVAEPVTACIGATVFNGTGADPMSDAVVDVGGGSWNVEVRGRAYATRMAPRWRRSPAPGCRTCRIDRLGEAV